MHNWIVFNFSDFNVSNNTPLSSRWLFKIKISSVSCILIGEQSSVVKHGVHFLLVDRIWALESNPVSSPAPTTYCRRNCVHVHIISVEITPRTLQSDCKKWYRHQCAVKCDWFFEELVSWAVMSGICSILSSQKFPLHVKTLGYQNPFGQEICFALFNLSFPRQNFSTLLPFSCPAPPVERLQHILIYFHFMGHGFENNIPSTVPLISIWKIIVFFSFIVNFNGLKLYCKLSLFQF